MSTSRPASIFVSYAREDEAIVTNIVAALEAAGFLVWWDQKLEAGKNYAFEINTALRTADVVVVIWSANSVKSEWVYSEAQVARERGSIVPLQIAQQTPPPPFNTVHTPRIDIASNSCFDVITELVQRKTQNKETAGIHRTNVADPETQAQRPKRILSIEGWNSTALIPCAFLEILEEQLGQISPSKDKFRLSSYFDLVVGTSWGSFAAAGVASGRTANEITKLVRSIYEELPRRRSIGRMFGTGTLFDAARLEVLLQQFFGDASLEDGKLRTRLLLPLWPETGELFHLFFGTMNEEQFGFAGSRLPIAKEGALVPTLLAAVGDKRYLPSKHLVGPFRQKNLYSNAGIAIGRDPSILGLAFAQSKSGLGWSSGERNTLLVSAGAAVNAEPVSKVYRAEGMQGLLDFIQDNLSASVQFARLVSASLGNGDRTVFANGAMDLVADLLKPREALCAYLRYELVQLPELHPSISSDRERKLFVSPPNGSRETAELLLRCARQSAINTLKRSPIPEHFHPWTNLP